MARNAVIVWRGITVWIIMKTERYDHPLYLHSNMAAKLLVLGQMD